MQLISVNIGEERPLKNGKRTGTSGIFKEPTEQPVAIGKLGLAGDVIIDTENHGGVDQAVYLYGRPDYDWWEGHIGRTLPNGIFGENLTISELESQRFSIGDRLQVGAVLLEVTAPRIPCASLAARLGDPQFVKKFRFAERPGLYCRVLETGTVMVGDPVTYVPLTSAGITIPESFRFFYEHDDLDVATIRRYLAAPIDIRSRHWFEEQLAQRQT